MRQIVHLDIGEKQFACGAKGKGFYVKSKRLVTCKKCKNTFIYKCLGW